MARYSWMLHNDIQYPLHADEHIQVVPTVQHHLHFTPGQRLEDRLVGRFAYPLKHELFGLPLEVGDAALVGTIGGQQESIYQSRWIIQGDMAFEISYSVSGYKYCCLSD